MKQNSIFLIDDDDAMLTLLAEFFASVGFEVHQFRSAESAVKTLEAEPHLVPSAIVSDVNMPVMGGVEFVHWMKSRFSSPIGLISAFGSSELENEAIQAGAAFFLKKPFALAALKAAVDNLSKAS